MATGHKRPGETLVYVLQPKKEEITRTQKYIYFCIILSFLNVWVWGKHAFFNRSFLLNIWFSHTDFQGVPSPSLSPKAMKNPYEQNYRTFQRKGRMEGIKETETMPPVRKIVLRFSFPDIMKAMLNRVRWVGKHWWGLEPWVLSGPKGTEDRWLSMVSISSPTCLLVSRITQALGIFSPHPFP